jgi:hypothetical protein
MGNAQTFEHLLEQSIEETAPRLYWPSMPYEGPVKLRFCCGRCSGEAILLDPYPKIWKHLVGLRGQCFKCATTQRIHAKFMESGTREVIWTYNGRDERLLGQQIQKFLRSGPMDQSQLDNLNSSGVQFKTYVHPVNFRDSVMPHDFLFPEDVYKLPLKERHKLFLKTVSRNVKTWDRLKIKLNREGDMLRQAYSQFMEAPVSKLRGFFSVKFDGEEEALDLGGVTREFFQIVSEQILDPRANLFIPQGPNNTFHPSPSSHINEEHLNYFRFFGRFLGKALMEEKLVKAPLTRALWKLVLGKALCFEDYQTVDKQIFVRLQQILDYDDETLEACNFVFAANIDDFGEAKVYPLKEGGEEIGVTRANVHEWIRLYTSWRMIDSVYPQIHNFLQGFYEVIPVQLVTLFNEFELEQVLCGLDQINVEDWQKHAVLVGFKKGDDLTKEMPRWFWQIMGEELTNEERGHVLQFATGSAQVPVSFEYLHPPFTIALNKSLKPDSLPYGHTCFNRIDLPVYTSKQNMRTALLKAVDLGLVGFGRK